MQTIKHTLHAWTMEGDLIPTLYIQGEITTNGEKPIVELKEVSPQGIVPQNLLLEFSIDVYDPNGTSLLKIENYSKILGTENDYDSVSIKAAKGDISLQVEHRKRE